MTVLPPDDLIYRLGVEAIELVQTGQEWEEELSRLFAQNGYEVPADTEVMHQVIVRLRLTMNRKDELRQAREAAAKIADEYRPLREEWMSWLPNGDDDVNFAVRDDAMVLIDGIPVPAERFEQVAGRLLALRGRLQAIADRHPELTSELLDTPLSREDYERARRMIGEVKAQATAARVALERDRRLAERAARRSDPKPGPEKFCSSCGRSVSVLVIVTDDAGRPISDGLCKRCAHEFGLMPHGKIGEA